MAAPYAPLAVANEFIAKAMAVGGVEHMKLQKLVYCANGWWLAFNERPLVAEAPEVWRHGPVFESLYHALKPFGRSPIKALQSAGPFDAPPRVDANDHAASSLIEWTWKRYGHLSSFALSDMTHRPGTPWHRVAKENDFSVPRNAVIPTEYIREEFRKIYSSETQARGPERTSAAQ